ncbi:MAG: hypothetical protein AAGB22_08885, partial [Bacteroidota bacterium]
MKTKFTLFGLLLAAAVVWLLQLERSAETDDALASATGPPFTAPQEPGWYKEWFEVRKNAQGVIPRGLRQQWAAHDDRHGTSRSTLLGTIWELGPDTAGGRTRALMANAANPGEFLAGGASGGLWYTVNGGTYWHPVDDQASTLMVSGITQNLLNPTEVYYCTGEGWGPAGPVPGDGIFKSTNGGASFTQLASTTTGDFDLCWDIVHSRVLHDLVLVGTHSGGIWRTTDGGTTWTNVMVTSQRVNDLIALPNGDFFAGVNGSGIFRSVDHGTTWTKITAGLPAGGFQRIALGFSEGSPDVIYAAMAQGSNTMLGIYKSTDGGGTWAPTGSLPTLSNSFTSYCLFIGVSEHNPEHVVYGAQYSYYSLDGGGTWTRNFGGHPDYHSYMDDPSDPDYFFLGTDGGIYRKSWASMATRGQNWNNGYHVTQFYAGDYLDSGIRAIGGTQDNGPQLGIDGGWRILSLA